jgi:hypothetical protein
MWILWRNENSVTQSHFLFRSVPGNIGKSVRSRTFISKVLGANFRSSPLYWFCETLGQHLKQGVATFLTITHCTTYLICSVSDNLHRRYSAVSHVIPKHVVTSFEGWQAASLGFNKRTLIYDHLGREYYDVCLLVDDHYMEVFNTVTCTLRLASEATSKVTK